MSKEREVDLQGNCSKCGGVHFGTGPDCVYGKPEQNRTIPPTLQGGREQPAPGEPSAPAGGASAEQFYKQGGDRWGWGFSYNGGVHFPSIFEFAEAYAAEQVRQAENRACAAENDLMRISKAINQPGTHIVPIADRAIKVIAELRQERDAADSKFKEEYAIVDRVWKALMIDQIVKDEREGRERAEGALREIADCPAEIDSEGRRVFRVSQADWKRALAALKSSQEEGKL